MHISVVLTEWPQMHYSVHHVGYSCRVLRLDWHTPLEWCYFLAHCGRYRYCLGLYSRDRHTLYAWISSVSTFKSIPMTFVLMFCRWAAAHGRWEQASRSIARISGMSDSQALDDPAIQEELEGIRRQVEYDEKIPKTSWVDCFRGDRKTRYRTLLGMSTLFRPTYWLIFGFGIRHVAAEFTAAYRSELLVRSYPSDDVRGMDSVTLTILCLAFITGRPSSSLSALLIPLSLKSSLAL